MRIFEGDSLDSLLGDVYACLIEEGVAVQATKGANREIVAAALVLSNPLARLSRSYLRGAAFSAFGEFTWYLSGSDSYEFIRRYIGDTPYAHSHRDGVLPGAYGPRLMGADFNGQVARVIDQLRQKPQSRQAVIQLFDARDLANGNSDVPCTCTLQFLLRGGRLELIIYMRSNDAYIGLVHDIFCFTLIQEMVARSIGTSMGDYTHVVGSLHLYERHVGAARRYLAEGAHRPELMPEMPPGDPWDNARDLVRREATMRGGQPLPLAVGQMGTGYWADVARMIAGALSRNDPAELQKIRESLDSEFYAQYFRDREGGAEDEVGDAKEL